ncbi:MAG: FAD-binding oxidoreductase [Deltaproteobacteria bacterium]|nr:MAG: FAD-binding oxidoreductase [Deltaproteobacteria bacterium]
MATERVRKNFWGWGWEERFPDEATRRSIGQLAAAFIGGADLRMQEPPALDEVELAPPRVAPPAALADRFSARPYDRACHCYGRNYRDVWRGFHRDFRAAPDWVVTPRDEADIAAVLDWAADARVAVIPYGGGTSVVGGIEAAVGDGYAAAVSLDVGRLDRVLEVDAASRAARIQAGASGPVLERQLAERGMTLRFFPQSFELSTLGGWIATRAGGHFATQHTHIDDLVESVRMITPRGTWHSRRLPASGAGPNPDRLALGSEGTLGVITEAWVRVRPRPRWRSKATVTFERFADAAAAARAITQAELFPANCRVLDGREAALNRIPTGGRALLLLAFESADHPVDDAMARALELGRSAGGRCEDGPVSAAGGDRVDASAGAAWRRAFVDMPYLINVLVSVGLIGDTFETACTWDRFDALCDGVIKELRDALHRVCGGGVVTCRITHVYPDGAAPYFTFVAPGRAGAEADQWWDLRAAAAEAVLRHGGTITHHHAVGRLHRPWYDRERPEPFGLALRAAKRAVDPAGVLNPGVLVDPQAE